MSSIIDSLAEFLNKPTVPNKFTIYVGEQVRQARSELKMSQSELAQRSYMRQAAISDIENGKREVTSSEMLYLCVALTKPIAYFYPPPYKEIIAPESEITDNQERLLTIVRRLYNEDFDRLILIAQAFYDDTYRAPVD